MSCSKFGRSWFSANTLLMTRYLHSDFLDKQGRDGWGKRDESRPRALRRTSSRGSTSKSPPLSRHKSRTPGPTNQDNVQPTSRGSTPSRSYLASFRLSDKSIPNPRSWMKQPINDVAKLSQLQAMALPSSFRNQYMPEALRLDPSQPLFFTPHDLESGLNVLLPPFQNPIPSPDKLQFHSEHFAFGRL